MRLTAAALALVPILAAAAPARADSCLAPADVSFGFGAGTHWRAAAVDHDAGFIADGFGLELAAQLRVACHVAVGARVASETGLELHLVGDDSPARGITDVTPEVTVGTRRGALRAQLSVGPAVYAAVDAKSVRGIGLGADVLVGVAVRRACLGLEMTTTIDPDWTAVSYLLVVGFEP